ncbi:MAG: hypothetical protein U5K56_04385 [Halioglobus sp.]|nr:hypothetical protein [Halioglobus sp.]
MFKGRNKSAVLSELMGQALEQEEQRKRRKKAIDQLLSLRTSVENNAHRKAPAMTDADIRKTRRRGRP